MWGWHLEVICDHVQAFLEKKLGKQHLLVNVPPAAMKSTIVSVMAPAWWWLHNPSWRALFFSGNESVGLRDSMRCREIIESQWYQESFAPQWQLAPDQNAKGHYRNTASGFRKTQSAGSRITGERADDIFVDDPLDAAEAFSKSSREAIIQWWDQAASNRLNDLRVGGKCIIQQRLHENDLAGHILRNDKNNWDILIIRQEYEKGDEPTSLNWVDPRKDEGELFFPERFPKEVVETEKNRLGSYGYAGQHQQRPSSAAGGLFKRDDWQFYNLRYVDHAQLERDYGIKRIIQAWDTAFKVKTTSDYSVGITIGVSTNRYYILDLWRGKVEYPELKRAVQAQYNRWKAGTVLVEDKASGQSIIQELRRDTKLPILAYKIDKDKIARAYSITPIHEAELIYLPDKAAWINDFIEELSSFPTALHDDMVDSFVMAIDYASRGNMGIFEYTRILAEKNKSKMK